MDLLLHYGHPKDTPWPLFNTKATHQSEDAEKRHADKDTAYTKSISASEYKSQLRKKCSKFI